MMCASVPAQSSIRRSDEAACGWNQLTSSVALLLYTFSQCCRRSTMSFPFPFNRAAHAGNLFGRPVLGGGDCLHRLEQIAANALWGGLLARLVEAAAVLQCEIAIETEKVGRAHCTVGLRHGLRLVEHIGEGKTEFVRHFFHVVEGILGVFGRIVRHDGDGMDAVI